MSASMLIIDASAFEFVRVGSIVDCLVKSNTLLLILDSEAL